MREGSGRARDSTPPSVVMATGETRENPTREFGLVGSRSVSGVVLVGSRSLVGPKYSRIEAVVEYHLSSPPPACAGTSVLEKHRSTRSLSTGPRARARSFLLSLSLSLSLFLSLSFAPASLSLSLSLSLSFPLPAFSPHFTPHSQCLPRPFRLPPCHPSPTPPRPLTLYLSRSPLRGNPCPSLSRLTPSVRPRVYERSHPLRPVSRWLAPPRIHPASIYHDTVDTPPRGYVTDLPRARDRDLDLDFDFDPGARSFVPSCLAGC